MRVTTSVTFSPEYIMSNRLQNVARDVIMTGDITNFAKALMVLSHDEGDAGGLNTLKKLFSNQVYFHINTDNSNLMLFNEGE